VGAIPTWKIGLGVRDGIGDDCYLRIPVEDWSRRKD
jgi:hypothetical protein